MYFNNGQQQPYFMNGGYTYGARPTPKCTQPITPELSKMLNQQNEELDIRISNVDKVRNWCTHKEPTTGRIALVDNGNGTVTCRVCGSTFHMMDSMTYDEVKAECEKLNDILQTIKTAYLDCPDNFIREYYQTMSMISKIPDLWNRAFKNFSMYESYTGNVIPSNNGVNTFAAASGILNGFNIFGQQPYMYPSQGGWMTPPMGGNGMMPGQQMWPNQGAPMNQAQSQQPNMVPNGMPNQMVSPGGAWTMPQNGNWMTPPQQAGVPYIDPNGQVMPGQPMGPTTMNGNPMNPGFNPLVNNGVPGANMSAPTPTGPAQPQQTQQQTTATTEPVQTKQITV